MELTIRQGNNPLIDYRQHPGVLHIIGREHSGEPLAVGDRVTLCCPSNTPSSTYFHSVHFEAEVTSIDGELFTGEVASLACRPAIPPNTIRPGSPIQFTIENVLQIGTGPRSFADQETGPNGGSP